MDIRPSIVRVMARCRFWLGEPEGQSMVEYSLILVLMIVVCLSVLGTLSDTVNQKLFQVVVAMP